MFYFIISDILFLYAMVYKQVAFRIISFMVDSATAPPLPPRPHNIDNIYPVATVEFLFSKLPH